MANLLEEASILLTATAYDNGRMLSVKPIPLYGSELVTNGDFSNGTNDWEVEGFSSIIIGSYEGKQNVANINIGNTSSNSRIRQSFNYVSGKKYKVSVSVYLVSGSFRVDSSDSFVSEDFVSTSSIGSWVTLNGVINATSTGSNYIWLRSNSEISNFYVESISIKEVSDGDFDFSRNSSATRVNAQGLVENVQILSSDLVSNGNFSQEGVQEVSNGSFSQEGSELITNGDFSVDGIVNSSSYTLGWYSPDSGISISAGKLIITNGGSVGGRAYGTNGVNSISFITSGKSYKLVYTIKENNDNALVSYHNGGSYVTAPNTVGTHTIYYQAGGGIFILRNNSANTTIKIDNVSVKEVGQDWTLGTGWSIGADKALNTGGANFSDLTQNNTNITIGKNYEITYTVSDYVSGSFKFIMNNNSASGLEINADGTYTDYISALSQGYSFRTQGSGFIGSITNISVKEVGQDWVVGSGWSIGDNKSTFNLSSGAGNVSQINVFESGKTYRITFDTLETNGGNLAYRIGAGGFVFINAIAANTKHTITETATSDGSFSLRGATNFNGSITNISILEITDDTNLPRINYDGFSYQDSLGSEEVVNGDFATDTNWSKGTGWNISGGTANCVSDNNNLKQDVGVTANKTYKVTFDVSVYTSGVLYVDIGSSSSQTTTSSGSKTFYFTTTSTNDLRFYGGAFRGSIDNVSVKEVLGQEVVPNSGCGSWLMEGQSTNLIPYSEDFSNASWYPFNATVLIGFTSPSGVANASKLVESISNSSHGISYNYSSTSSMAFSVFAKAAERTFIQMQAAGVGSTDCIFNLSNGTIVSSEVNATADIKDYGNGWYRCSIYYNSAGTNNATIKLYNGGDSYQGDGASGVYIWGAMLEQKSYSTSYIPTTQGAISTRLRDIASNSGNASLINSSEGTLYLNAKTTYDSSASRRVSLSDGTTSNRVSIEFDELTENQIKVFITLNGASETLVYNATDLSIFNKIAVKWKANDFSIWFNGIQVVIYVYESRVPLGMNELSFDGGNGSNDFFGKTKALAVFKNALTDEQLTLLTTI